MDQSIKGEDFLLPRIILSQRDLRKKKDPVNPSLVSRNLYIPEVKGKNIDNKVMNKNGSQNCQILHIGRGCLFLALVMYLEPDSLCVKQAT